jgi:two-component system, response regulator
MNPSGKIFSILIAEDDDDDFLLTQKAFQTCGFAGAIRRVKNGEELMRHLLAGAAARGAERVLILLDLNMPRKDGRECLKEIKSDPQLRNIPVVVLSTSTAEADIVNAYALGANSFMRKPASFEQFAAAIASLKNYWSEVVEWPTCGAVSHT